MKKWLVIIGVFVLILLLFLFKIVYYSGTNIQIVDSKGIPFEGARVWVTYSCTSLIGDVGGGHAEKIFGYREVYTKSDGFAKFNNLFLGVKFLPFYKCRKYIVANYFPNGIEQNLLYRSDSFHMGALKQKILIKFERIENFEKMLYELKKVNCEEYNLDFYCDKPILDKALFAQNISLCETNFFGWSFNERFDMAECITKIAKLKKDPNLCLQIYYTSVAETNKDKFSPRYKDTASEGDTIEFQKRCFNALSKELGDISLCRGNSREIESCKLEAIKTEGDISDCALIKEKDIRLSCKIYLS